MKRMSLTLLLLCLSSIFVAGCNTVEGVGKDVKEAGSEIEDAAK